MIGAHVRTLGHALSSGLPADGRRGRVFLAASVTAGFAVVAVVVAPVAAGLGLLAFVALVVAFQRPYLIGPAVALLLPASDHAEVLGAQVAPLEAAVGGAAIGYVARIATRQERLRLRVPDWIFVAFLASIALSVLGPVDNSDRIRELLFWGALGVVFYAVGASLRSRRDSALFLLGFALATLVEASYALYEYVDHWSERSSLLNGAIVFPLPQGTLGHRNALGQFLVLAVLAVLALTLAERGELRRLGFVAVAAGSLALVVTLSRASWIAFAVGVSVYLLERRARVPVLAAGAVVVIATTVLAFSNASAIGARISSLFDSEAGDLYGFRLELIGRGARIATDHPLTGIGQFREMGVYAGRPDVVTHPHNLFVGIAVFFGISAALAFAGLVGVALRAAWRGFRTSPAPRRLTAVGFLAVLVAFLVNGLLEYPFWNVTLTALVVLVLAVASTLDLSSRIATLPPRLDPRVES